jgi:S1-C subfamily serine protease
VQTGEQPDRLVRASNSGQLPRYEPRLTPGVNLPMGIGVQDSASADKTGAEITQVQPNSAGEAAGLKIGDVITEVDGTKIGGKADFDTAIGHGDSSAGVTMLYNRSGEKAVAIVKP